MENTIIVDHDIVALCEDPAPTLTPKEATVLLKNCDTESKLADLYATAGNKFWWDADEVDDYPVRSKQGREALKAVKKWSAVQEKAQKRIVRLMKKQGVSVTKDNRRDAVRDFMYRNGYCFADGWWVGEEDTE